MQWMNTYIDKTAKYHCREAARRLYDMNNTKNIDSKTILIVDDDAPIRELMAALLYSEGYELFFAENGHDALKMASENIPDMILLDAMMPKMDGFEVCRRLRKDKTLAEVPVVMLTGLDDRDSRIKGFEAGIDDFLTKPCDRIELRMRIKNITKLSRHRKILQAEEEIRKKEEEIADTQKEVIFTLGEVLETRSHETGNHVRRVAELSWLMAIEAGEDESLALNLKYASPMHDVGKVGIPDAILLKPGKLTTEEFELMKTHTTTGYKILKNSNREIMKTAAVVAHEHHEQWDGKGYPQGLKGEKIHLYGRITKIADVFDALSSDRCYKKAWEMDRVFELISKEREKHFDPQLTDILFNNADKFIRIIEKFPDLPYKENNPLI